MRFSLSEQGFGPVSAILQSVQRDSTRQLHPPPAGLDASSGGASRSHWAGHGGGGYVSASCRGRGRANQRRSQYSLLWSVGAPLQRPLGPPIVTFHLVWGTPGLRPKGVASTRWRGRYYPFQNRPRVCSVSSQASRVLECSIPVRDSDPRAQPDLAGRQ